MSELKISPGDWKLEKELDVLPDILSDDQSYDSVECLHITDKDGNSVAWLGSTNFNDARAIVEIPEMIKELKRYYSLLCDYNKKRPKMDGVNNDTNFDEWRVKELLARIEGTNE